MFAIIINNDNINEEQIIILTKIYFKNNLWENLDQVQYHMLQQQQ